MPFWTWIPFENAYGHLCPTSLVHGVTADILSRRGGPVIEKHRSRIPVGYFDLPGMRYAKEPQIQVWTSGYLLEIAITDLLAMAGLLASLPVRRLPNSSLAYYKLKGFHRALCLTPSMKAILQGRLERLAANQAIRRKADAVNTRMGRIRNRLVADGLLMCRPAAGTA